MQEVDTLVQYVISPIWTYFANLKSEKWNLATIFLFLLILFQDVSWYASKIFLDMIWITKKNLIWSKILELFFFDKFIYFFEILPSVLYSNFVLFFLRCSTYSLVFGCRKLSHVIFLKLRKKERTAWKTGQIHKMTTIFTKNDRLGPV